MTLLDVFWQSVGRPWSPPQEQPLLASRFLTGLAIALPTLHVATMLRLPAMAGLILVLATQGLFPPLMKVHASLIQRQLLRTGGRAPLEAIDAVLATSSWPWLLWPVLSGWLPEPGTWMVALGLLALQLARAARDLAHVSGVGADRCLGALLRPIIGMLAGSVMIALAVGSLATALLGP